MKITSVKTYLAGATKTPKKNFVFCRVEADDGIVGWGEAYAIPRRERGILAFVKGLGEMLVTLDNPTPQSFMDNVTGWYDEGHLSIDLSSAVSALEVALWDMEGKRAGKPVCDLLGDLMNGVLRRSLPVYANMDPLTPEDPIDLLVERCIAIREQGFTALKIYPMEYAPLDQATECVRRVREAIGDDAELLLDIWALDDADYALQAAHAFAPFNPFWFEEPIAGERVDEMATLRSQIDLRVVTGERQMGQHHFRQVLEKQAADILNPDIVGAGGILEMIEIAKMADAHGAMVSPHCWDSTLVGTAAMVHTCAVLPNALIGEHFPQYGPFCDTIGSTYLVISDSTAVIGDAPGLGVEMDEKALAQYEL